MWHHRRRDHLRLRLDRWLCLGQQLGLSQPCTPNNQLAAKDPALFHRNRFRRHVAIEHGIAMNNDRAFRDDFTGHSATDFDGLDPDPPEKLDNGFPLHQNMFRR